MRIFSWGLPKERLIVLLTPNWRTGQNCPIAKYSSTTKASSRTEPRKPNSLQPSESLMPGLGSPSGSGNSYSAYLVQLPCSLCSGTATRTLSHEVGETLTRARRGVLSCLRMACGPGNPLSSPFPALRSHIAEGQSDRGNYEKRGLSFIWDWCIRCEKGHFYSLR